MQIMLNTPKESFQLLLNMFLAPHLHHLYLLIRHSSISQYFDPFLSADIRTMAREFRTSPEDVSVPPLSDR